MQPVQPVVGDPLERLVRSRREPLADALRTRGDRSVTTSVACDAAQCRYILAAARREIQRHERAVQAPEAALARVRARLAACERQDARCDAGIAPRPDPGPRDTLADPPTERKAYAPPPLGAPLPARPEVDPVERPVVVEAVTIARLGMLIDVWG